jgi:hypothetical protein
VSAMGHRVPTGEGGVSELKRRCLETLSRLKDPPDRVWFRLPGRRLDSARRRRHGRGRARTPRRAQGGARRQARARANAGAQADADGRSPPTVLGPGRRRGDLTRACSACTRRWWGDPLLLRGDPDGGGDARRAARGGARRVRDAAPMADVPVAWPGAWAAGDSCLCCLLRGELFQMVRDRQRRAARGAAPARPARGLHPARRARGRQFVALANGHFVALTTRPVRTHGSARRHHLGCGQHHGARWLPGVRDRTDGSRSRRPTWPGAAVGAEKVKAR